jgi:hypothetical protein
MSPPVPCLRTAGPASGVTSAARRSVWLPLPRHARARLSVRPALLRLMSTFISVMSTFMSCVSALVPPAPLRSCLYLYFIIRLYLHFTFISVFVFQRWFSPDRAARRARRACARRAPPRAAVAVGAVHSAASVVGAVWFTAPGVQVDPADALRTFAFD